MIVDLDETLYVIDEKTHSHKVSTIDVIHKIVHCTDGTSFEYGTCSLTVTIKEI